MLAYCETDAGNNIWVYFNGLCAGEAKENCLSIGSSTIAQKGEKPLLQTFLGTLAAEMQEKSVYKRREVIGPFSRPDVSRVYVH
jgi:hypothetical protein